LLTLTTATARQQLLYAQNNIDSGLLRAEFEAIEALKGEEEEETDEGRL
jgi:hypothetical protein